MSVLVGPITTQVLNALQNEINKPDTRGKISAIIDPIVDDLINKYIKFVYMLAFSQIVIIILLIVILYQVFKIKKL